MEKKNLIGFRAGKLTVISAAPNIKNKKDMTGRSFTAWTCRCECGKIIIVRTASLKKQKSCGCHISQFGIALKPNQKINRLTTISYKDGMWKCICECQNIIYVKTSRLINENTKSCGCLRSEKATDNIKKAIEQQTIYHPSITSARRAWKGYLYQDKLCDLTFEQWYDISQQNCFYCGIAPSATYNMFLKKKDASQFSREAGFFIFNGLDRIDSNKHHTIGNCVPCCYVCNRAKNDLTSTQFLEYISHLIIKTRVDINN